MSAAARGTAATTPTGATGTSTRGTWVVIAWLGGLLVVVVALVVLLPSNPPPYAITSEQADGTDILRRVLADLDVEVVEGPADDVLATLAPVDVAVVFVDRLSDAQEAALGDHLATGGDLVVADPRSALAGEVGSGPASEGLEVVAGVGVSGPPGCDLLPDRLDVDLTVDGFAGIGPADVPNVVEVPPTATASCWERDGTALVVQEVGPMVADGPADAPDSDAFPLGTTTVLADVDVLTNAAIMARPVLAQFTNLFVPEDPAGRVVVVVGDQPPPADAGVPGAPPADLVDGMWLVGIALALFALARARRHGRVLAEAPPVQVPASELAVGIAELLQRHGEVASAARRLRAELRAEVGARMGAGHADEDGATLVDPVVQATGLDRATADLALRDQPVASTDDLLDVAAAVRRVRAGVMGADPDDGGPAPDDG